MFKISDTSYVVAVPFRNGERVAAGWSIPLSKKAATKLKNAFAKVDPQHYGKGRTIMAKTARRAGIL